MTEQEIKRLINSGESSKVQFKERLSSLDNMAYEMIAFSNSTGGLIIIGVNDKTGELNGLSFNEIQDTNQKLVNIATQKIFPQIIITTETVSVNDNALIIINIDEGTFKPYKDSSGIIYIKNGTDKRKVNSNDEIARLLQSSGSLFAEEKSIDNSKTSDINSEQFDSFLYRKYNKKLEDFIK